MLANSILDALSEGETFPHEMLCEATFRNGFIRADAVAAWFPDSDPNMEYLEWAWGERTDYLDPSTGMVARRTYGE
jgi:hypothetical protein